MGNDTLFILPSRRIFVSVGLYRSEHEKDILLHSSNYQSLLHMSISFHVLNLMYLLQDVVCYFKTTLESSALYFSSFSILLLAYDKFLIIAKNKSGLHVKKVMIQKICMPKSTCCLLDTKLRNCFSRHYCIHLAALCHQY